MTGFGFDRDWGAGLVPGPFLGQRGVLPDRRGAGCRSASRAITWRRPASPEGSSAGTTTKPGFPWPAAASSTSSVSARSRTTPSTFRCVSGDLTYLWNNLEGRAEVLVGRKAGRSALALFGKLGREPPRRRPAEARGPAPRHEERARTGAPSSPAASPSWPTPTSPSGPWSSATALSRTRASSFRSITIRRFEMIDIRLAENDRRHDPPGAGRGALRGRGLRPQRSGPRREAALPRSRRATRRSTSPSTRKGGEALLREIEKRLGDQFKGLYETVDVPYTMYQIYKGDALIGYIHGVNQKGHYGGIQVFLALDLEGTIKAFYLQKLTSKAAKAVPRRGVRAAVRRPQPGGLLRLRRRLGQGRRRPGKSRRSRTRPRRPSDDFRAALRAVEEEPHPRRRVPAREQPSRASSKPAGGHP